MNRRALAFALPILGLLGIVLWLRATRAPKKPPDVAADAPVIALPEPSPSPSQDSDAGPPVPSPVAVLVVDADAGPSVECDRLAASNALVIAKAERADAGNGCPVVPPDIGCATSANGVTWGYRLVRAGVSDQNLETRDSGNWSELHCEAEDQVELVREDDAGVRAMPDAGRVLGYAWYVKQDALGVQALADYDGDGEAEILLSHDEHEHEGGPVHEANVLTYKGGALGPYPPAAGTPVEDAADLDHDGRPDLLTRGPYDGVTWNDAFGNDWKSAPVVFAAHALPGGTFSTTDAVAMAYTRRSCPTRPKLDMAVDADESWDQAFAISIVCARVWGATEQDVTRMWDRSCRTADAGDFLRCQVWPKELGAVKPPFTLR